MFDSIAYIVQCALKDNEWLRHAPHMSIKLTPQAWRSTWLAWEDAKNEESVIIGYFHKSIDSNTESFVSCASYKIPIAK